MLQHKDLQFSNPPIMFFINGLMVSAIVKEGSFLTNVLATLTSTLVTYKTYMNMSYNLFLFTSPPTFYFSLKTKITFFYLTVIGVRKPSLSF